MRTNRIILFFFALLSIMAGLTAAFAQTPTPPPTRRENVTETLHGVSVTDPYHWLEDQNSPETRAWIDAQNSYTHSVLNSLPGREAVSKRYAELFKTASTSAPTERGGRYFYKKRLPDQDQGVVCYRQSEHGDEEVLIDPNSMKADHSMSVGISDVSHDGKLLAYEIRIGGKEETELHLFDVDARHDLADRLPTQTYFSVSILPDRTGLFYSIMTDEGPRVRFHKIGADTKADLDVFGAGYGKDHILLVEVTDDGTHLIFEMLLGSSDDKNEVWIQDLAHNGSIRPLVKGVDASFFSYPAGDQLLFLSNWKAPNRRVLAVSFADIDSGKSTLEQWHEIIPESKSSIQQIAVAQGRILVNYAENATSRIKTFAMDGRPAGEVPLAPMGNASISEYRWDSSTIYVNYQSYTTPSVTYSYNVTTSKRSIWTQKELPFDGSSYVTEQVWFSSKDGTRVPMFLVHTKHIKRNGSNPTLLTGYGGFNISTMPGFDPALAVWLEHGGVLAEVNLRGGNEFGESWHRAGMLANKQNVFDDFVAAAEWLIEKKYTQPAKLAIKGGSNGGLLVGAALTQRPDLFRAVLCTYPLLDMLRYDQFLDGPFWVSEYGSAKDPEQFKWLYAYSPYQHVKNGVKYPAVLFITGDGDTRVAPLHARKMTAALQADTASNLPILLRYDTTAGHAGGQSISNAVLEQTDTFSFLASQLGMHP